MTQPASTRENAEPLGKDALAHFEQRLLEERKRALREMGRLTESFGTTEQAADGDLTTYPMHQADMGTDTMEQEKNFLLASQEGRLVWDLDEALRRLYAKPETFGRCERCGRSIPFERLDALPQARFCIDCMQLKERGADREQGDDREGGDVAE